MAYRTPAMIQVEYAVRAVAVENLAAKDAITVADLQSLDRIGRFSIACHHWSKCDHGARQSLFNDAHPHVRSAAQLAA